MIDELGQLRKKIDAKPPINVEKVDDIIDLRDILYKDEIVNLIDCIKENVNEKYLPYLYKNFNTLKIDDKFDDHLIKSNAAGCYVPSLNTIYINKYSIDTLFHEGIHAACTCCTNDRTWRSGFEQTSNSKYLAYGLNEFYTELLTFRFLNKLGTNKLTEINLLRLIETLITKEKMMNYYFSADLQGLINELAKYCNLNYIKRFINSMDCVYYSIDKYHKGKTREKAFIRDYCFFSSLSAYYCMKIMMDYSVNYRLQTNNILFNDISEEEHLSMLTNIPKSGSIGIKVWIAEQAVKSFKRKTLELVNHKERKNNYEKD